MEVSVTAAGKPALDTSSTWGPAAPATGAPSGPGVAGGPISRGYREEMEDFAYCVRMWDQGMDKDRRLPRCHGQVAMADAIVALSANIAMRTHQRIEFKDGWFDPDSSDVPDSDTKPKVPVA
jgi:hypothetical protein